MTMRQPDWFVPFGNLLGLFSLVLGAGLIASGVVSAWWLLLVFAVHIWNTLMTSAGLHRYFSHGAFKTSKFWHTVMCLYSPLLTIGSALAWSVIHLQHHIHSDTDRDSHYTHWTYIFWKQYRKQPIVTKRMKRLLNDPTVVFAHRWGLAIWTVFVVSLALISWKALLFGYLMPLGVTHLIGGIHQVISHKGGQPRNLPWLEWVLPAGGEWNHGTHHKTGKRDLRGSWWHLDPGFMFIRLIEKKRTR